MNQRKLIKLGNSSYAIALPKDWVDKSGLGKGDNVYIMPNSNGELIIQPTFKKESMDKEKIIKIQGMDSIEIGRNLVSAYVGGSKLIRMAGEKAKIKIAKQKAKIFLNLEPIEEDDKSVLFKDLLDVQDTEINNFIRRMDNNIKEMFTLLLGLLEDKKRAKEKAKEAQEIDKDITKFHFLIWRFMNLGINNPAIQSNLKISPSELVSIFWISYNLEQIGDELKRTAQLCLKIKNKKEILKMLSFLYERYNDSMRSFFNKDRELAKLIIFGNTTRIENIEKIGGIKGLEVPSERLHQINASIYRNAKMTFYNL